MLQLNSCNLLLHIQTTLVFRFSCPGYILRYTKLERRCQGLISNLNQPMARMKRCSRLQSQHRLGHDSKDYTVIRIHRLLTEKINLNMLEEKATKYDIFWIFIYFFTHKLKKRHVVACMSKLFLYKDSSLPNWIPVILGLFVCHALLRILCWKERKGILQK